MQVLVLKQCLVISQRDCVYGEFSLHEIVLRHVHVATVARATFWWVANVHSHMPKDRKLLSYS